MRGHFQTAGETISIDCAPSWVADLIEEGAAGELRQGEPSGATVHLQVERRRGPFDRTGWEPLTRGAWKRPAPAGLSEPEGGAVVLEDACGSGFDLEVSAGPGAMTVAARWRPPWRDRAASWLLRSRFHLLARAALVQFPAMWLAGTRGRVPLHAPACSTGGAVPLLAGPGGVGKTTLLLGELAAGARATGDNVSVGDGRSIWGVLEPFRASAGPGRRMPHGRREMAMTSREPFLQPDTVVVVRRGTGMRASLEPCSPQAAARSLATGTYMAGELRRYWAFAATLSAGTGLGPPHPMVSDVSARYTAGLPCFELLLPESPSQPHDGILRSLEEAVWTSM